MTCQRHSMRKLEAHSPLPKSKEGQTLAPINTQNRASIKASQNKNGLSDSSDVSQGLAEPIVGSNLLYRRLGRPKHKECQRSRDKTDCNCCKRCMSIVRSTNGILDELKRGFTCKKEECPA